MFEMNPQSNEQKKSGYYFGTEIDRKWWKRYKKEGFFSRGNGKYDYDEKAFYFYKYPSDKPIIIPLRKISEFEIGKWHAGKWGMGMPVLKIIWESDDLLLSSGFLLSKNRSDIENIISDLKRLCDDEAYFCRPNAKNQKIQASERRRNDGDSARYPVWSLCQIY